MQAVRRIIAAPRRRAFAPLSSSLSQLSSLSQSAQSQSPPQSSCSVTQPAAVPLRKQLKDAAKTRQRKPKRARVDGWELTVGIEVHAQLDVDRKLFSKASSADDAPNSNVALFDLAFPGSQPIFSKEALIPALRAALAFDCQVSPVSHFDRKHYFYHDQPAGYQITQYYEPYAKDGELWLHEHDGVDHPTRVGIQQIQMEQDTAKSQELASQAVLLDFNRVSRPLIEIITRPDIHSPAAAAACVRKIQAVLKSCGVVRAGMEMGGLRADVNVSVRPSSAEPGQQQLGQRTEIKNLSSFKAVEDAVIAERDRQIAVLQAGGTIEGETRGWTIGGSETRRLRDKEGAVDYRYMPDADLPPVIVGADLLAALRESMPPSPDELLALLTAPRPFNLPVADAKPLLDLDDGARLEYYLEAVELSALPDDDGRKGRTVANWVLHELGGLFGRTGAPWDAGRVSASSLAAVVDELASSRITGASAKRVLAMLFEGDGRTVGAIVQQDGLAVEALGDEQYLAMAQAAVDAHPQAAEQVRQGQMGKLGFLVGVVKRTARTNVDARRVELALRRLLAS